MAHSSVLIRRETRGVAFFFFFLLLGASPRICLISHTCYKGYKLGKRGLQSAWRRAVKGEVVERADDL